MRDNMIEAYTKGWAMIPLKMNSKVPNLPKGHKYLTEAPDNHAYKTWTMTQCFDNYGIVTGKMSGITVVDVDFPEGNDVLHNLGVDIESISTPQVLSPNGRHLYFKYSTRVPTGVAVMGKGIDVRNDGAYVVGPGSVVNGEPYVWSELYGINTKLAQVPDWLQVSRKADNGAEWKLDKKLASGERNNKLASLAGALVIRDLPMPLVIKTLMTINNEWSEEPLDREEVEHIAKSVERYRNQEEQAKAQ